MSNENGRNIDASLGTLSGEGSHQVSSLRGLQPAREAYALVPSESGQRDPSYYDLPLLKQPVWIWAVPLYLYVGGLTGTSVTLGAAAQALEPRMLSRFISRSRWVGTVGGLVSSALLIHDLGRPERFLYMLRVFRPSSPMSVGSWILSAFSSLAGLAAVAQYGPRPLRLLGNLAHYAAGIFGLGLAGYTAVLLANTAVPIWQLPRKSMPFLFLGSATASAASFFDLLQLTSPEERMIQRFGLAGKALEVVSIAAYEAEVRKVNRVAMPLSNGIGGFLWQAAKVCAVASLVLSAMPGKSRKRRTMAGIFGTLGGLCLRFGVYYMGKGSARDPHATFQMQRRALPAASGD